jgi:hypothetical protein
VVSLGHPERRGVAGAREVFTLLEAA